MGLPVLPVASLLFCSGFCALIYQVAWLRELRMVFGASTAASAAVLAVFMGGLGLGGALLGRRVSRSPRPLAFYGNLELGVAAAAGLTPVLVWLARAAYLGLGGTVQLGAVGGTLVRLVFSVIVLGLPTFLMGGTLPAAAQAVETEADVGRRNLAVLYGLNTLGAVAGALLANFALIEVLGNRRMLWSAAAVNAIVALAARAYSRRFADATPRAAGHGGAGVARLARFPLVAAALVGFVFLLMELVWYRMLGPLLGGSSFTFGLILAVALAGIGTGGVAYALFGGKRRATALGFAVTCAAEAACIAIPWALGDRIALWSSLLQSLGAVGFYGHVASWTVVTVIVVFPASFVAGVQFPLLLAWVGQGDDEVGRQVGLVYAWNTVGAIAGSLAGGFGLLPLLSAPGAWRLVVMLLLLLAAGALAVARPTLRRSLLPVAASFIATACMFAIGPTAAWRHSGVGVGHGPKEGNPNSLRQWANLQRRAIVWDVDGRESSVALETGASFAFVVNGKVDGNSRGDAETQVMGGLLGAILHGHVKRAAVVGLGTGSTAGWLGAIPGIERVDVAELEPAVLRVARQCAPVNQNVLDNPRVHIFLGDAREYLLTSRDKYDLVFSEPSNPYRAGIASLFTEEFYRAVDQRLADDGILVQWVQSYAVDAQTVRTIYATLASVFPTVDTWVTEEPDIMLVASRRPIRYDAGELRARIAAEPYASALQAVWQVDDLEGFLARFVARSEMARAIATAEGDAINTDDQPLVEFGFARTAGGRARLFSVDEMRATARERHEDRPSLSGGTVDWQRVLHRRLSMLAAEEKQPPQPPPSAPEPTRRRARAYAAWLDGNFAAARHEWNGMAPDDPLERLLVAECGADAADESIVPLVDAMRARRPIEADVITARLRLRQGRSAEAARALAAAFTAYRDNPWPSPFLMFHALELANEMGARDHALAATLYAALEKPFAVEVLDEKRRSIRLQLAGFADFNRLCRDEIAHAEPWIPWRQDFLALRLQCYEANSDPRAAEARRDLARYLADEPLPFANRLEAR